MLRLPPFQYYQPKTLRQALKMMADNGPGGMYVAGGTDLYPNMKRRHQDATYLVALGGIKRLSRISSRDGSGLAIGSCVTLTQVIQHRTVGNRYPVFAHAADLISTPLLRNMGTVGGNLCLDTRCNYYNQTFEWRKAIDFCMKKDGSVCWVAPGSPRCWAINSSDLAPVTVALDADFHLVGPHSDRVVPARDFYRNDGIEYVTKQPDEILTEVRLPVADGWDAVYWKLRRRGSFDFPVLGVATWVRWDGARVSDARIVLGAVASEPQTVAEAAAAVIGTALEDDAIETAATLAFRPSKPMDNTDFALAWRKEMTRVYVRRSLQELRARRRS